MELTKEEIKTIEKKRSLNRVKSLRLLEEIALENKKAIKQSQNDINNQISRAKENLERKKESLEKLQKVGDFILEIETRECSETPYYYKDNNKIWLNTINYKLQVGIIKYNGETLVEMNYYNEPRVVEYTISVEEHRSGSYYSRRSNGYKMNINGIDRKNHRSDYGQRLTRPEKVIQIIKDDIEYRKRLIQDKKDKESLKEKALNELKTKFKNATIEETDIYKYKRYYKGIKVSFKNGVNIDLTFSEDYNDETKINYSVENVSYAKDGLELIEFLSKLKF